MNPIRRVTLLGSVALIALFSVAGGCQSSGPSAEVVALSVADAEMHGGQPERALRRAMEVLDEHPDSAMGNEIAGKALLKLGAYEAAEVKLLRAEELSSEPSDIARIADLIRFNAGLRAHSHGDLTLAKREWAGITNEAFRAQVFEAYTSVTGVEHAASIR